MQEVFIDVIADMGHGFVVVSATPIFRRWELDPVLLVVVVHHWVGVFVYRLLSLDRCAVH